MTRFARITKAAAGSFLLLVSASGVSAQRAALGASALDSKGKSAQAGRLVYQKAFVIDDRLSALRREPSLQSEVVHRLRLGRAVYIISANNHQAGHARFVRVAVTRRTRGWILLSAIAVPGRAGEDQRLMGLIDSVGDGFDRIRLCQMLIESFGKSQMVPRALLLLGEEADRAAETLSQRARKRLAEVNVGDGSPGLKEYYMNDTGLDRYSKVRVVFDFNESIAEFVYDGRAYSELVRRFPGREETALARQRIEVARQKMARRR